MSNSLPPHGLQPARLLCPWGFSRKEYWSGLSCPSPGDLPNPGIKPVSLTSPVLAGRFLTTSATWEAPWFHFKSKVKVKVAQMCPTLCNPMDCTVHGILQARILEWVALPFSRGSSQPRDRTLVSHIAGRLFTVWATREAQLLLSYT